jgi:hypothetical protein
VKYLYYDLGSDTQIHVDFHKADFYILQKKNLIMDRGSDNYFTAKMKAVRTSETEVVPLA